MPTPEPSDRSGAPLTRVVLLGASNLTRGISTVVETAGLVLGGPVEILAALGHGRSYGLDSRVLARGLPGIIDCGIWDELERRPPAAVTHALVTDIGNDIMYGASPEEIISWIDTCLARLAGRGARTIMTRLPLGSIEDLGTVRFAIARAILYPARGLTLEVARARTRRVDALVRDLASKRDIALLEQERHWYGLDPVHIKMKHWPDAWARILGALSADGDGDRSIARGSFRRWARLRLSMPQRYTMFGRPRTRQQPAARLADGTTVSLY